MASGTGVFSAVDTTTDVNNLDAFFRLELQFRRNSFPQTGAFGSGAFQINCQVPFETARGTAFVQVLRGGRREGRRARRDVLPAGDCGGVSGYACSFFGVSYSTGNLLGYGQTVSFDLSGGSRRLYASVGLEFRVQVPMLNVPFRMIFAYSPNANPNITDPRVLSIEKRTVRRFSVGRTF